jgi:hypothetical protein
MKLLYTIFGCLLIVASVTAYAAESNHQIYVLSSKQASAVTGKQLYCLGSCCDIDGGGPCSPGPINYSCTPYYFGCYAFGCVNPGSYAYTYAGVPNINDACDSQNAQLTDQCALEPDTSDFAGCEEFEEWICVTTGWGPWATCNTVDTGFTKWLGDTYECTLDSNDCL